MDFWVPFYGRAAIYEGKEVVQLKVLSDRRDQGGGIAWLVKFAPPPGKLIKIVAIAADPTSMSSGWKAAEAPKAGGARRIRRLQPQPQGPSRQCDDRGRIGCPSSSYNRRAPTRLDR